MIDNKYAFNKVYDVVQALTVNGKHKKIKLKTKASITFDHPQLGTHTIFIKYIYIDKNNFDDSFVESIPLNRNTFNRYVLMQVYYLDISSKLLLKNILNDNSQFIEIQSNYGKTIIT